MSGRRRISVLLAATLALTGCAAAGAKREVTEVVVGAAPDAESLVLSHVYAAALGYYGSPARVATMGDPLAELDSGAVGVVPGFTGRVLQRFQPGSGAVTDPVVYRMMVASLPEGFAAGDYATAAEDKPVAAVTEATAVSWGGRELTALARNCARVISGTVAPVVPQELIGGCKLPAARQFPSAAELFDALRAGSINAAWTTTAQPDVPGDVLVLADRHPPLVQAENVVPVYRRNALSDQQVLAINEVAGELDTAALADMRRQVAGGADPGQLASAWLAAHPLGR